MEGGDPISKEMAIETRIAREDQALDADILELGPSRPIPVRCVTGSWSNSRMDASPAFAAIRAMRIH
jgi:hypothetical protein